MRSPLCLMLVCVAGVVPIHADLVTLRNNESYYGTILSLTSQQLTLRAQSPNHTSKDLFFERSKLARIEFNDQKSNVGEPPEAFGSHQGTAPDSGSASGVPKDTVIFRDGGQNKTCPGTVIDEKTIKCGDSTYVRSERTIWRIYFAGP